MNHSMKLDPEPFEKIISGRKTIEARLFDEKRRGIKVGDTIKFIKRSDYKNTVSVRVYKLEIFPSFENLFTSYPAEKFGGISAKDLLDKIYKFYSKEDEKKYSVLGIFVKLK